MMKKLIVLLALILVAGVCFAQEEGASDKPEKFDLEITIGFPVHWTNSLAPHDWFTAGAEDKTVTANTAIGLALLFNLSKKFGFTVDVDLFYGGEVAGISNSNDSYSANLFGVNALVGPVIYLYNGSFLRIPLALGIHVFYWSSDAWLVGGANYLRTRDLQFGPGAYLGIQFHFNESIYIFSRTTVAFDVVRWHSAKAGTGSDSDFDLPTLSWLVKPALGVGVKF